MPFDLLDKKCANTLRGLAIDCVQAANSGHPGLPLGMADVAYVLFSRFIRKDPQDTQWINRDRFVLSGGHGSALLYSILHLTGHAIEMKDLRNFRQWQSVTPGHPEHCIARGIETTTGPLGQGISQAVGMALAEVITEARVNTETEKLINHYTYVIASDGDLMEGVSHEACSFAGAQKLGKLIVLYDDNGISIDGELSLSCKDNASQRFEAYGWHTQIVDGHNMESVETAIANAQRETEKPSIICCRTQIGFCSPFAGTPKVHGTPLGVEGVKKTKETLGLNFDQHFHVDEDVRNRFNEISLVSTKARMEWDAFADTFFSTHSDCALFCRALRSGDLPSGWESVIPSFEIGAKIATRVASNRVLDSLNAKEGVTSLLSQLFIGGSADLTPSNNTLAKDVNVISPLNNYHGGYIHYGIREHGMGQIMNGLSLYGYRPFGGTFLVFSDYMRPSVRAASMMGLPVVYVWTHDSIGLGEDGPTHQPIEHFAALRAIPNLIVFRPCDANEVAGAWKYALAQKREPKPWVCEGETASVKPEGLYSPCALLLSRQNLTVISPNANENKVALGGYVIRDNLIDGKKPEVVLIATGSEVEIACEASELLKKENVCARVVSMPSCELFEKQSQEYRDSVLLNDIPIVCVEVGCSIGWHRFFGTKGGIVISLDRYGASAPYQTLFKEFGFTAEHICERVRKFIGK